MNNKLLLVLSILIFSLGLTGCGSSSGSNNTATKTDAVKVDDVTSSIPNSSIADATTEPDGSNETDTADEYDEFGFKLVEKRVQVIDEYVKVRIAPDASSDVYMFLERGKTAKCTGYNNEWARIILNGSTFYVTIDKIAWADAGLDNGGTDQENDDKKGDEEEDTNVVRVVVLDASNQSIDDNIPEEIGPNSSETKAGGTKGPTGVNGTKAYKINFEYTKALAKELEGRGYTVVLIRDDVDETMTNKERANKANSSGADIYIRIGVGYSTNDRLMGISAVTMTSDNPFNSSLYDKSYLLATRLIQGAVAATNCDNQGIICTEGMTSINYSKIPVATFNIGFISNEEEEALLLDEEYRASMIIGIADGVDLYFNK